MTESSAPWDGISVGDASASPYSANEWGLYWSKILGFGASRPDVGIIKGNSATPASSVAFYGLDVRSTGSAVLTLKAGTAIVTGTQYENTTDLSLTVGANSSGNARIDTVILRKDYTAQTIRAVIKQGTPAASPVPPTLTQSAGSTWEIPLCDIAVANGFATIAQTDLTPRQGYINIPDSIILDNIQNKSGGTLVTGDVVIWNTPYTSNTPQGEVTTTTTANDRLVAGVWIGRTAANGYGRLQVKGLGLVNVGASTGGILVTRTTAKQALGVLAQSTDAFNSLGFQLEQGTGLRMCYIDPRRTNAFSYTQIVDSKAAGANGGTFTSGAWQTRALNTINEAPSLNTPTISGNQITLPSRGLWYIRGSAVGYNCDGHQTRLQNISAGTTLELGTTEYAPTGIMTRSYVQTFQPNLIANNVIELQHRCVTTRATDGFGKPANFGSAEIYATLELFFMDYGIGG